MKTRTLHAISILVNVESILPKAFSLYLRKSSTLSFYTIMLVRNKHMYILY